MVLHLLFILQFNFIKLLVFLLFQYLFVKSSFKWFSHICFALLFTEYIHLSVLMVHQHHIDHSFVRFICGFRSCVSSPTVNWSLWVLWSQSFPHHRINAVETVDHRCWVMLHIVVIRRGHYKQSSFRQNRNIVHLILKSWV